MFNTSKDGGPWKVQTLHFFDALYVTNQFWEIKDNIQVDS